jgi:hypothetical protein
MKFERDTLQRVTSRQQQRQPTFGAASGVQETLAITLRPFSRGGQDEAGQR